MAKYQLTDSEFVNPYNFVSLEENCKKGYNYKDKGKLTGYIDCEIEAKTPLFIPNTTSVDDNNKSDVFNIRTINNKIINSYDFFSYTDLENQRNPEEPVQSVIPGSEIRGVIRSAFETITNSCMSTIDDEQELYKRVTTAGTPGRIEWNEQENCWLLYQCERYGIAIKKTCQDKSNYKKEIQNWKEGQKLYFKIGGSYKTKRGIPAFKYVKDAKSHEFKESLKGFLHKGEPFGNRKHHESIFVELKNDDGDELIYDIDENEVKNLLNNIKLYNDETINLAKKQRIHSGYKLISKLKLDDIKRSGALVYFKEYNGRFYFSPASIGREVFYNRISELIGNYKPCDKLDNLCLTCSLFGLAGKDESAISKLRFTDAKVIENSFEFDQIKILKELASPKISATEFYLKKTNDNPDLWNYDYAGKWERYSLIENYNYTPKINGRKYYWHHKNPLPYLDINDKNEKPSERNVAIRPLKKGKFKFKVFFDKISKKDLMKIIWTLEIGGRINNAHKIGMGKPLGLGSIRISIDKVITRAIELNNDNIEYKLKDEIELKEKSLSFSSKDLGCSDTVYKEFLKITDFVHTPSNIMYPKNTDSVESFKWFMANKQIKGTGTKPIIEQELGSIDEPSIQQYKEFKPIKNNRRNR